MADKIHNISDYINYESKMSQWKDSCKVNKKGRSYSMSIKDTFKLK